MPYATSFLLEPFTELIASQPFAVYILSNLSLFALSLVTIHCTFASTVLLEICCNISGKWFEMSIAISASMLYYPMLLRLACLPCGIGVDTTPTSIRDMRQTYPLIYRTWMTAKKMASIEEEEERRRWWNKNPNTLQYTVLSLFFF